MKDEEILPSECQFSTQEIERKRACDRRSQWRGSLLSHTLVTLVTSLFWCYQLFRITHGPVAMSKSHSIEQSYNSTLVPGANYYHCGRSTEEARARGCEYDILNNHWVPTSCIDQAAIEEYQSDGSWYGYADANHTQLLDLEVLGDTPVYYTSERDHIVHCAMLWRKQFRALFEGRKYLDSIIVDEEHTIHCSQFLIDMTERGPDFSQMPIKVFVGYAGCHVRE